MKNRELAIKHLTILFAYLLVVWGFYRLLFQVPDPFDELLVKPAIWLIPLAILLRKERRGADSLGVSTKKLFTGIYLGLALGTVFAFEGLLVNYLKYRGINFAANIGTSDLYLAVFISFVTAVTEEITFRGYFFGRLWELTKSEWKANFISSAGFMLMYLPLSLFDWHLAAGPLVTYLFLVFVFGFASSFIYGRTKNIAASIVLHALWAWPIILFR